MSDVARHGRVLGRQHLLLGDMSAFSEMTHGYTTAAAAVAGIVAAMRTLDECAHLTPPPAIPPSAPPPPPSPPLAPLPPSLPPLAYPHTLQAGPTALPLSEPGILITLSKVITASGGIAPVARSYDGYPWELLSAAPLPMTLSGPANAFAHVTIPSVTSADFILDLFNGSIPMGQVANQRAAARLLMQATFGPRRSDLSGPLGHDTSTEAVRQFVHEQMALQPSLLRTQYRKRANPRAPRGLTTPVGPTRPACDKGSRWHAFALSSRDTGQTLLVESSPSGAVRLVIGNETRSTHGGDSNRWAR